MSTYGYIFWGQLCSERGSREEDWPTRRTMIVHRRGIMRGVGFEPTDPFGTGCLKHELLSLAKHAYLRL